MKSISNALMATLLASGATLLVAQPALAKKEEKQQAGAPALKLSNEVRGPAAQAQTALAAKDVATATPLVAAVEAAAKTDDEKYIAAALRLNLEAIRMDSGGNADALVAPLDALIANARTPQADKARYAYQRGIIAANKKDNAGAAAFFEQARQLGNTDPNLPLQIVKLKMDAGDTAGGLAELTKMVDAQTAAGQKPTEDIYRYAIAKTNQKKMNAETMAWIRRYLAAYPTMKNWRDMVVFWGIQPQSVVTLDKQQKIDLYRLLRLGKSLADQYDYEIYAQWATDVGLPWESKTILTEGKAAGKVPADSANATGLLTAANRFISNEGSLSGLETKAKAAANGKLAAGTADAYLGSDQYAKAVELYRVALQKGGVDADTVNTRLGIALARSGDKEGAKAAFQAVKTPPRSDIAAWWIDFLDHPPVG
ncbi:MULTISPECIES: hypothetical protein [Sphingomonas]|jgi:hypothetical protein|uniref:hypothetical protein n=1 Tax=Sphingomonas TaxID=13687 RepID=UPI00082E3728|nr:MULTISPECIES: hypothetical protein [Sphingomonas]MBY0303211.1 hypothetical protein [Sphingomonas ginsenosidimutans]